MGSPYLEVVRTYVTRWQVVVSGGLLLAWLLLLLVVNSNYRRTPDPKSITPVIVPLLSVFLGSLCVHAMQMLYNWRTRLLPGHAKYTLIVASSIGVLACGFSGAGIAISTTATLHGAMALSFLTFVVSAWAVWGSRLSSLVPLLLYWVVWFDPPARIVERALTDSRSIVSVGILLTSGAALFLLACRWIRFCRDQGTPGDPSVPKWLALDASPDRQGMLETGGGPIARFLQWQRERRLDAVLAEGRGSLRFCYRRLKAAIGEPPLGLATMVLTLGTTLIGSQLFASRHRTEDAYSIVYACVWLVLARLVFGHSIEWKSNLQRESARPITRRRILLLQMSVTLCETVSVWLGLCGGVLLARWINDSSSVWRLDLLYQLGTIAGFIWVGTAAMVFMQSAYRCIQLTITRGVCVIAASLLLIIAVATSFEQRSSSSHLWLGGVAALLGLVLTIASYKLWLRADWD